MFIKEPGELPTKPHMLVCIDTESLAIMGSDLLRDPSSPHDMLSLPVVSMEKPGMVTGAPILPESVRLDNSAVLELIGSELGQLGVKFVLVKRLSALREFRKIVEREWFSQQGGIREEKTEDTYLDSSAASKLGRGPWEHPALKARLDLPLRGGRVYVAGPGES
jgi:hypothetical protein